MVRDSLVHTFLAFVVQGGPDKKNGSGIPPSSVGGPFDLESNYKNLPKFGVSIFMDYTTFVLFTEKCSNHILHDCFDAPLEPLI